MVTILFFLCFVFSLRQGLTMYVILAGLGLTMQARLEKSNKSDSY